MKMKKDINKVFYFIFAIASLILSLVILFVYTASAQSLQEGLLGYYTLNESSGGIGIDSLGKHNATNATATNIYSPAGKISYGRNFTSDNNKLTISGSDSWTSGQTITISMQIS